MSFKDYLNEGLMHDRYERSHGKKARGEGSWMFTTKRMGEPDPGDVVEVKGKLGDAAKEAMKKLGSKTVYVMESSESKEELNEALNEIPIIKVMGWQRPRETMVEITVHSTNASTAFPGVTIEGVKIPGLLSDLETAIKKVLQKY